MKFAAHLAAHITPEWRIQYINYKGLKQQLYEIVERTPSAEKADARILARYFVDADEVFLSTCEKELVKVNTFYSEKIAEAMRKFVSLQNDLAAAFSMDVIEKPSYYSRHTHKIPPKKPSNKKVLKLKVAFSEFYLSLVLLQNYQTLNYHGFRKILKKHDKLFSVKNGEYWRRENVDCAPFYVNKDSETLIEETENVVTNYLENGNREKAMKRLHIPPIVEHQSLWTTFKLGLLMGIFLALFGIVIFIVIFSIKPEDYFVMLRLYRGTFFVMLFLFLCGVNVYGWRTSGVNYILIFEINPRNHLTEQHIMEISMMFAICWTFSMVGFVFGDRFGVPRCVNPLLSILFMSIFLLNPTKTFFHEARLWFLTRVGRILLAPYFKVGFADFWIAEQMTSLAPVFLDFYILTDFYIRNRDWTDQEKLANELKISLSDVGIVHPLILSLPAWFRLTQCLRRYCDTKQPFPHLISVFKYLSMILIVLFSYLHITNENKPKTSGPGAYFYLWIFSVVFTTMFIFLWDVKLDWGLLNGRFLDNKFLREQLLYDSEMYYFAAMANNFVLRFCWAFSISFLDVSYEEKEILGFIVTFLEIFRRFLWNFFRLENEHLNNCGEFRAIRDISIVPLESFDRDQHVIVRMMDDPEGVTNRRQKVFPQLVPNDKKTA